MKSSDIMTRPQDLEKSPKPFLNITNQMSQQSEFQRESVSLKVEFPIFIQFSLASAWKPPHPTHISKENSNAVETNQDPFVIKKRTKGKRNISLTFFVPLPLRFPLSFLYLDRKNLASVVSSKVDRMQCFHFSCQIDDQIIKQNEPKKIRCLLIHIFTSFSFNNTYIMTNT